MIISKNLVGRSRMILFAGIHFCFSQVSLGEAGLLDPYFYNQGYRALNWQGSVSSLIVTPSNVLLTGVQAVQTKPTLKTQGLVEQLNVDGSNDNSFSNAGLQAIPSSTGAYAIAQQADGRKVIVGQKRISVGFGTTQSLNVMVRLNSDGSEDRAFNNGSPLYWSMSPQGTVILGNGQTNNEAPSAVAISQDGKIYVAGYYDSGTSHDLGYVTRFTSSGALDTGFNQTGVVTSGVAVIKLALQCDGKLVGLSTAFSKPSKLFRLGVAGSLDTSFGTSGSVTIPLDAATALDYFRDPTTAECLSSTFSVGGISRGGMKALSYDLLGNLTLTSATIFVDANGHLGSPGPNLLDQVSSLAVEADGKVILAGANAPKIVNGLNAGGNSATLIRFDAQGNLDANFGTSGVAQFSCSVINSLSATQATTCNSSVFTTVSLRPEGIIAGGNALIGVRNFQVGLPANSGYLQPIVAQFTER